MKGLNSRYLMGDLKAHKGVAIALAVLLTLCAALMAIGAGTLERLSGAVEAMNENTKPPHYLQMHYGEYDVAALEEFAAGRDDIDQWLIEEMVGFDSNLISFTGGDFSSSVIDNLFVAQNEEFDFLVDTRNEQPADPQPGEVFIPMAYHGQFPIDVGDTLDVAGEQFTVAGFVRDGQMVSSMAGSTRFLVHESALDQLAEAGGQPEIIVEFRVPDPAKDVATLQSAYEGNEQLPRNGQAITHALLKLISMLSSGVVAFAFIFASLILMAIALLAVRFVIGGTLEDQIHQVGVLKAIGLSHRHISQLFLMRYVALTAIGCVLGGIIGFATLGPLTRGFTESFGASPVSAWTVIMPLIALFVVAALVIGLCWLMLRRLRKVEVVTALVHGQSKYRPPRKAIPLRHAEGGALNWRLATIDLIKERGQWALLPVVFFLAVTLILLPATLQSTFGNPQVSGYMGVEEADVSIYSPNTSDAADSQLAYDAILAGLRDDPKVAGVEPFATVLYSIPGEKGWDTLPVDVGDHSNTTIKFTDGHAPQPGELALSLLNADKYQVQVGDQLELRSADDSVNTYPVVGIYQDITGGGFTAMLNDDAPANAQRWSILVNLRDPADSALLASQIESDYADMNVVRFEDFAAQTLSFATAAFGWATMIAWIAAIATVALITFLFLNVRIAKERRRMGLLNVLGFSTDELTGQVFIKALGLALLGIVLGILFMVTLGPAMVSGALAISGVGMQQIALFPTPWLNYLVVPLSLLLTGALGVALSTQPIRHLSPSSWLRA
ncbi:FtsX-like permease family protein [Corynebacterium breve]|uniref:FtsX-like permease family protein n=1 Tax=Corynebacterium breve TaxID=3049799 RepID=A0ABY8VHT9_9CORY|nr:ABC transporter permease [Corynebacterium breve]WIM67789.1 FtsX-like permease family protein [Corynebacterium breve]